MNIKRLIVMMVALLSVMGCTPLTVMSGGKTLEPVNSLDKINVTYLNLSQEEMANIHEPSMKKFTENESIRLGSSVLKVIPSVMIQHNIASVAIASKDNQVIDRESLKALTSQDKLKDDLLVIKPIRITRTCYGSCISQFTVSANLFDPQLNKTVWGAVIDLPTPATVFSSYDAVAEKLANTILEKMKVDGVLK